MRKLPLLFLLLALFFQYSLTPPQILAQSSSTLVYPAVRTPYSQRQPAPAGDLQSTFSGNNANAVKNDTQDICSRSYTITNSFEPKEKTATTVDPNTGETITEVIGYDPYLVRQVQTGVAPNTALAVKNRDTALYTTNKPDVCASDDEVHNQLANYNLLEGLNMSDRSTTLQEQECLKGRHLVGSIFSLYKDLSLPDNVSNDMPVAYDLGGRCSSKIKSNTNIFLSQIANSLKGSPIFYDYYAECTAKTKAYSLESAINVTYNSCVSKYGEERCPPADSILGLIGSTGTTSYAKTIYKNLALSPIGSTNEELIVYNIEEDSSVTPTIIQRAIPFGANHGDNSKNIYSHRIGSGQKLITRDPCADTTDNETIDEKNPISFMAYVKDLVNRLQIWVTDTLVTHSETIVIKQVQPAKQQQVFNSFNTMLRNYTTLEDQSKYQLDSLQANATSDKNISASPGNDSIVTYDNLFKCYFYTIEQQQQLGICQ